MAGVTLPDALGKQLGGEKPKQVEPPKSKKPTAPKKETSTEEGPTKQ